VPARDAAPSGAPCWIDLFSSDPDRAAEFYGRIFGWSAEQTPPEYGGYVNFTKNGVMIAGMMRNDGSAGQPDAWTTYLSTPDAKATSEAAAAAGGQVHLEPMQVMHLGTMGMVADPGGAAVGLWQPGEHKGYGLVGEAGAPVWHELHTRRYQEVLDFYRTVFGWETSTMGDTDDFRYTQMVVDGTGYAGVMDGSAFLPEGVPSTWQVYIGVEDVDAALQLAGELGGTVLEPALDTPYGRLAKIADPTGATIKLSSLPA
jgi:predicted enzyme related to lactoylglutathione lyase